jgi:hypothetical protein
MMISFVFFFLGSVALDAPTGLSYNAVPEPHNAGVTGPVITPLIISPGLASSRKKKKEARGSGTFSVSRAKRSHPAAVQPRVTWPPGLCTGCFATSAAPKTSAHYLAAAIRVSSRCNMVDPGMECTTVIVGLIVAPVGASYCGVRLCQSQQACVTFGVTDVGALSSRTR